MPGKHPHKFADDGTLNPTWHSRPSGNHPHKFADDGTLNPSWHHRVSGKKGANSKSGPSIYTPKQHTFYALDGEGITTNGVHSYVLLMCSDGSVLRNLDGISTVAALDWLIQLGDSHAEKSTKNRNIFVGFSIPYDVNMLLRDLSWSALKTLHEDGYVWWRGYRIEWKPQKYFSAKRWRTDKKGAMHGINVFDSFGFYQTSFVKAIEDWLGNDSAEYALVKQQKSRRHEFQAREIDAIALYCSKELHFLVELLDRLDTAAVHCGLNLTRYDGAGAIAGALMRKHAIKRHLSTEQQRATIANGIRASYFGGRIEQVQYGTTRRSWDYDINSAYVRGLCDVPSLSGGVWKKRTLAEKFPTPFSLVHCSWNFPADYPFYAFPYRQPNGFAMFPKEGKGWHWGVEVIEPLKRFPQSLDVDEWWEFQPATDVKPYDFLWDLYRQRAEWKAEGNQAQKALKLGLNSLYGKHAQHVGWTIDRESQQRIPPSSHQLEYAGFTTAYTRAQLWMLGMSKPDSIIAFQTDGVYANTQLQPHLSTDLGDWTQTECGVSVFVQSGVYFTHADTDQEQCYSRGFDQSNRGDGKAYLSLPLVRSGWESRSAYVNVGCTRFVTFSSGLAATSLRKHWRTWRTVDRKLGLTPAGTKRMAIERNGRLSYGEPESKLVRTIPLDNPNPLDSEPYPLPWEPNIFEMDGIPDRIIESELRQSEE